MSKKPPSPCIDVCKYRNRGHCIACSMTKLQKSRFKALKKRRQREDFVALVIAQQQLLGGYRAWPTVYRRKCAKKGVAAPL
jgi:predicted Fe-S protein YdhL (DUF1289 family)